MPRAARHGECATETPRHRELLGFLCGSVPLWQMALCLAGRVDLQHGLPVLVEACVETVASAVAAERGGAPRPELCANLTDAGTTPSTGPIPPRKARGS